MKPSVPDARIAALFNQALAYHQQGRLHEAAALYQNLLAGAPRHFEALHALGVLYGQVGDFAEALRHISAVCAAQPDNAGAHYNLGKVYQELQRYPEALASYERALALQPAYAEAHGNRGSVLLAMRRYAEALASFDQALARRPDSAAAHFNRAASLEALQDDEQALAAYERSIALRPDYAEAHLNRGNVLKRLARHDQALASYDLAIALRPDYAEAHNNRGAALEALHRYPEALAAYDQALALAPKSADFRLNRGHVLRELRRYEEALAAYDAALRLRPDYAEALNDRGNILRDLRRYAAALASYDQALARRPDFAEAHVNRGLALKELKRFTEALSCYDRAIALAPAYADAHFYKGILKILLGDYAEGWPLYEWRWKAEKHKRYFREFTAPLWLGEQPITGKTILLHAEQGLGDVIQFARYVPRVEALGAKVVLGVPAGLATLLSTLAGHRTLVTKTQELPPFDLHCPLMSLPLAFKTRLDSIPTDVPYLHAAAHQRQQWRERLESMSRGTKSRPRIGLAWSGNPHHHNDRNRSLPLHCLQPLLELDGEFHSLQKEVRMEDQAALAACTAIQRHEEHLHDFAATAALIAELDVLITVDTAVAHVAGALGKPVWILLPYVPDYRWLLDRSDSPWYPSARLFRQEVSGEWDGVIEAVRRALRSW